MDYFCTICNKPFEIDEDVTTIQAGIVWESHIVPCDSPNEHTLCQRCAQDLDGFLRTLAEIRQDPFYKGLILQQFATNLVKKGAT